MEVRSLFTFLARWVLVVSTLNEIIERTFGTHILRIRGENRFDFVFRGDIYASDLERMYDCATSNFDPSACALVLVDMTNVGAVHPSARRLRSSTEQHHPSLVAYVGASFALRLLSAMFFRAIQTLARRKLVVYEFLDNEADARRWLDETKRSYEAENRDQKPEMG